MPSFSSFRLWFRDSRPKTPPPLVDSDGQESLRRELEQTQGAFRQFTGFLSRLQGFGVAPTGRIPRREFAQALADALGVLLEADQVILFHAESPNSDLVPLAGRGLAPEELAALRVRPGEGVLGHAAQNLKPVVSATPPPSGLIEEGFLKSAYMLWPLAAQACPVGLLLIAKPRNGGFDARAQHLASLLAAQTTLILQNHNFFGQLHAAHEQAVEALVRAIEAKDTYTHRHSGRTRALVRAVAHEIGFPEPLIQQTEYGALLHDVGKIGIEDAILKKPDKLTAEEYRIMKNHPEIGERILAPLSFLRGAAAMVLYHQEWFNGQGYPEGLAGEEIPLGARLVQILDAWDAMTSQRTYRPAMAKAAASAELRRHAGTQFDPKLVDTFLKVVDRLEREGIPTTEKE
jgi:HD-GYP domain-containing protein (c-di-GMP phosphodiesterase class II)